MGCIMERAWISRIEPRNARLAVEIKDTVASHGHIDHDSRFSTKEVRMRESAVFRGRREQCSVGHVNKQEVRGSQLRS